MFGAGKPSTDTVREKIAFDHIPSFLGVKKQKSTNIFLVQLSPVEFYWIWSREVSLRIALYDQSRPDCSLQAGLKGLRSMDWPPSYSKSFVCDHATLGKALQAINNLCKTAVDMFAGNQ